MTELQNQTFFSTWKWSDPLVGLQVKAFKRFLDDAVQKGVPGSEVKNQAEHLCEWSRNLLNRAFGRTSREELEAITELFGATSEQIKTWALQVDDSDEVSKITSFADHIAQRTELQRISP